MSEHAASCLGTDLAEACRMVEILVGSILAAAMFVYVSRRDRRLAPPLGTLGAPPVAKVPDGPRPRRSPVQLVLVAIGPLTMLAGLLMILWPQAPSDCHGSPVCALDAFDELGKLILGAGMILGGLAWLAIAGAATAVHNRGVNDSTRRAH
jgi:hypothetical protein